MKYTIRFSMMIIVVLLLPILVLAQSDSTGFKKDTAVKNKVSTSNPPVTDSSTKLVHEASATAKSADSMVTAPKPNCYKEWADAFAARGAKAVPDGEHEVVIAFKSGESCHCFMGKVQVAEGKIKPPLYVQTEAGAYKTYTSLGKKLDPEFVAAEGDQLWKITDGMSVLFKTMDNEYGRLFFYKFVSKGAQTNKKALSPAELIKD